MVLYATPIRELLDEVDIPTDFLDAPNSTFADVLNRLYFTDYTLASGEESLGIVVGLLIDGEIALGLPGLDGFAFVFGSDGAGGTLIEVDVFFSEQGTIAAFGNTSVSLRFPPSILSPVPETPDGVAPPFAQIVMQGAFVLDGDGNVSVEGLDSVSLAPAMIGETGIIISAEDVKVDFSRDETLPEVAAAGFDETFMGIFIGEAQVTLPPDWPAPVPADLVLRNAVIGTGGVSGILEAHYTPTYDPVSKTFSGSGATQLGGFPFGLTDFVIELRQNALVQSRISGLVLLPVFEQAVAVDVTIGLDGTLSMVLSANQPPDVEQTPGGLIRLEQENVFRIDVESIRFDLTPGLVSASLTGLLTPLFNASPLPAISWPSFRVEELGIDSTGRIRFAGGWIDLPDQLTLELFGFLLEITRVGFGTNDAGENWLGFNGSLKLVDGVPAGASVEGLRILWGGPEDNAPHITLEGVGVELEIPGVLRISGQVSLGGEEFKGAVRVELPAVSFQVEGQFVAGSVTDDAGQTFKTYAVYLQTQLPAGIPLGPTGLAFYGLAGLYAHNREPDKQLEEGWYRNPDLSDGWYTRGDPDGITDVGNKWRAAKGHTGFGAGIILGTLADNGYVFNGRLLLVLVFPGPVILIEGMANLFRKRSSLGDSSEPNFHALVVIEPGKSFTAGLDAQYKFGSSGELLDIRGSAQAFFNFEDASKWYVNLGVEDPRSNRIRARAFQLFDVNAFFMLNAHRLRVGAGWAYHKRWGFKHLNVTLSASMDGAATVSWHPVHFKGSIGVAGSAELRAFGIGAGVSVSATVSGDVFHPFGLAGTFRVGINLPWPLPDIRVGVSIEWKEDTAVAPALPVPVREASVEHLLTGNTWPLVRGQSLRADDGGGAFEFERSATDGTPGIPERLLGPLAAGAAPRIPADAKVAITFTRPMNDPAEIANYAPPVDPEIIGDPERRQVTYTVGYGLASLELQKWAPGGEGTDGEPDWVTIRQGGAPTDSEARLSAVWQPGIENRDTGYSEQNKLFVHAVTPFDYTAARSKAWQDWFLATRPGFPCPLAIPELSARFTQEIGTPMPSKEVSFADPAFSASWVYGGEIVENDLVIPTILGPIDRGEVVTQSNAQPAQEGLNHLINIVTPEVERVLIRIGTPKLVFRPFQILTTEEVGSVSNPFTLRNRVVVTSFDGRGANATATSQNRLVLLSDGAAGLEVGQRLQIVPPSAPPMVPMYVEIEVDNADGGRLEAFSLSADGVESPHQTLPSGRSTLRFRGTDSVPISMVVVRRTSSYSFGYPKPARLRRVSWRPPVVANVFGVLGATVQLVEPLDGLFRIHVEGGISSLNILGEPYDGITLLEMALPADNQELIRHTQDALSRLMVVEDPLFEPDNDYRLVVGTNRDASGPGSFGGEIPFVDHAYFHVVGPPGIGAPDQPPEQPAASQTGITGLSDLSLYIVQTLPPTLPAQGDKRLLPRAFYRGYDVAVQFKEVYTELMYQKARRSLTTRLFDVDNNPVRGKDGRVSIPVSSWERTRQQLLRESVTQWIGRVNENDCRPDDLPPLDVGTAIRPQTLSAPSEDNVLRPETLYQARLVPALLHETFIEPLPGLIANGVSLRLERWVAEVASGEARWEIGFEELPDLPDPFGEPAKVFFVKETTGNASSLLYAGPLSPTPSPDAPEHWSDFRASVRLRWAAGIVGLDVRRASGGDLVRLTLDRGTGARRLFALSGGAPLLLADDVTTFPDPGTDVLVSVECVGDRVQVFQDEAPEPIFTVPGAPTVPGTLALYVESAPEARFSEVRVDDLRPTPSAAFTFDFVTSRYTNFHHHLHGFAERVLEGAPSTTPLTTGDLAAHVGSSIAVSGGAPLGAISDAERRAFEVLEAKAMGTHALRPAENLEISRVSAAGAPTALLVRSPEPLLWERTSLEVNATVTGPLPALAGELKLTDVAFAVAAGDIESVTVLVRAASSLAHHRLEWRPLPSAGEPDPAWTLYFAFGESEPELDDGTQVRVLAIEATDAPQREPGTLQRFAEAGVHFVAPGVELRLLGPDGVSVVHQRRFATADAFSPFAMQALRKLDGTAILLFVAPSVGGPAPAALRLRWTFTRALADEELRFRQGGSETPEVAVLDLVLPALA